MALGNSEKESLKSLVKSCLLEINKVKTDMTILEKEKSSMCNDDEFDKLNLTLANKEDELLNKEKELVFIKESHTKDVNELKHLIEQKDKNIQDLEVTIKENLQKITELNILKDSLLDIRKALEEDFNKFRSSELDKHNEKIQEYLKTIVKKDLEITKLNNKVQEYQLTIRDLENNISTKDSILELEKELKKTKEIICKKDNELSLLKGESVPKDDLIKVRQEKFESETLLSQKDEEISRLKEETISKNDFLKLQEDLAKKEEEIKHLEEVNQLFSDMEYSDVLNQNLLNINNQDNNSTLEGNEINQVKEELVNAKLSIKELEAIKERYDALIAPPKADLTSFQSQVYNLIPVKPMNAVEIHQYIKNVAFDKITLTSINNIIKNFLRKGYMEIKEDGEYPTYIKINK